MKKVTVLGIAILIAVIGYFLEPQMTDGTLPSSQLADLATTIPDVTTTSAFPKNIYPVVKVVDGDTLDILIGGKTVRLRLIGLDTPETVDPRKPVQCFGKEASDKAKEILAGTSVRLEMDPSQGTLDKYGRTLAYVYIINTSNNSGHAGLDAVRGAGKAATETYPDGTAMETQRSRNEEMRRTSVSVNEYMIAEGYGHEYTYNLPYKYQKEFKAAEQRAREEKRGLWADGVCN